MGLCDSGQADSVCMHSGGGSESMLQCWMPQARDEGCRDGPLFGLGSLAGGFVGRSAVCVLFGLRCALLRSFLLLSSGGWCAFFVCCVAFVFVLVLVAVVVVVDWSCPTSLVVISGSEYGLKLG